MGWEIVKQVNDLPLPEVEYLTENQWHEQLQDQINRDDNAGKVWDIPGKKTACAWDSIEYRA